MSKVAYLESVPWHQAACPALGGCHKLGPLGLAAYWIAGTHIGEYQLAVHLSTVPCCTEAGPARAVSDMAAPHNGSSGADANVYVLVSWYMTWMGEL